MAQTQNSNVIQRIDLLRMTWDACKTDNVSLLAQAIAMTSNPEPSRLPTAREVVDQSLPRAVRRAATRVLSYLLDEAGADVRTIIGTAALSGSYYAENFDDDPSLEVLEILCAHGWDINSYRPGIHNSRPLLWGVLPYADLVVWCLAHGASVQYPGDPPTIYLPTDLPPLLETAAGAGTVATFELLRSRGAALGRLTLHRAVESAGRCGPPDDYNPSDDAGSEPLRFKTRMNMVRHLVDVVGLDVNADGLEPAKWCSTPLCYLAYGRNGPQELIWFLLDRGADPNLAGPVESAVSAMKEAQMCRNTRFLQAVREWQERQQETTAA